MRKKIKTNLDEAVQYLEEDLVKDNLKVKGLRNIWMRILKKIILYI